MHARMYKIKSRVVEGSILSANIISALSTMFLDVR